MEYAFSSYREKRACSFKRETPIWILGRKYENMNDEQTKEEVLSDISSRFWLSYRKDFPPISPLYNYTTDAGWGCIMRSGQMLLAQAFSHYYLGRDWRLSKDINSSPPVRYFEILSFFHDTKEAHYSIHNIAQIGTMFNKKIGEWFGPTTIAQVLQKLVFLHESNPFTFYISDQSYIYLDEVEELCTQLDKSTKKCGNTWRPLIIMMPLRLGLDKLNEIYVEAICKALEMPQSLGIVGGKPKMSFYFLGYQGDKLIYLDPHTVQMASTKPETYHCNTPQKIKIQEIDPSLAIGFLCKNKKDFEEFVELSKKTMNSLKHPIIRIQQSKPKINNEVMEKFLDEEDFGIL